MLLAALLVQYCVSNNSFNDLISRYQVDLAVKINHCIDSDSLDIVRKCYEILKCLDKESIKIIVC